MSVSIAAMENSAVDAGGASRDKESTPNSKAPDSDDESDRKEAEDDRDFNFESSAIDALDVAQLKVELETAREEAQIRIDELKSELREV